jgi:hypothetical protein
VRGIGNPDGNCVSRHGAERVGEMKKQIAILRALLRNYRLCLLSPKVCRMLIYRRQYFPDDFIREVVGALMLNYGDWDATKADLSQRKSERFKKFCVWAERVKGGAL